MIIGINLITFFAACLLFLTFINTLLEFHTYYFRLAGAKTNKKSLGWALQNAYFSASRLLNFFIVLLFAICLDFGVEPFYIVALCGACILGMFLASLFAIFNRSIILERAQESLLDYYKNASLLKLSYVLWSNLKIFFSFTDKLYFQINNKNIHLLAFLIYSLFGISVFIVCIAASFFPEFRATILQFSAIINGLGTFLLTSILDPKLSRALESDNDFQSLFEDVVLARFYSYILFCPIIITSIYLILL